MLALSGGGFRATLFHLGVIASLRRHGLLKGVRYIASVSGGSVLAAHMVSCWDNYTGDHQAFVRVSKELIAFTNKDVRGRLLVWVPLLALARLFLLPFMMIRPARRLSTKLTVTHLFVRHLRGLLRATSGNNKRTPSLHEALAGKEKPSLHVVATNVRRPCLASFSEHGFVPIDLGIDAFASSKPGVLPQPLVLQVPNSISLAEAVAASAAFPIFFPPLTLYQGQHYPKSVPEPEYLLIDGGAVDNLAITKGLELLVRTNGDVLFVSDASGAVDWDSSALHRFALGGALRSVESLMMTANDSSLAYARMAVANRPGTRIEVAQIIDPPPATSFIPVEAPLGQVRTDFDGFSELEMHCLTSHGQQQADAALKRLSLDDPKKTTLHDFRSTLKRPLGSEKILHGLKKSGQRRISLRTGGPWAMVSVACVVVVGALCWPQIEQWRAYKSALEQRRWVEEVVWSPSSEELVDGLRGDLREYKSIADCKPQASSWMEDYVLEIYLDTKKGDLSSGNAELCREVVFDSMPESSEANGTATWRLTRALPRPSISQRRMEHIDHKYSAVVLAGEPSITKARDQLTKDPVPPGILLAMDEMGIPRGAWTPMAFVVRQRWAADLTDPVGQEIHVEISTIVAVRCSRDIKNISTNGLFRMLGVPHPFPGNVGVRWREIRVSRGVSHSGSRQVLKDLYADVELVGKVYGLDPDKDVDPLFSRYEKASAYQQGEDKVSDILDSLAQVVPSWIDPLMNDLLLRVVNRSPVNRF
ncbi:MAG: hypothetical protein HOP15_13300 [Planctomycetes bacterium]|nr:hypothetical protein [Planctomycetota bacterium]